MVAENCRQQVGGVTVGALEGRPVAYGDDGLLLVVGAEDRLERARPVNRARHPVGRAPCQAPQCELASSTRAPHSALPANASTILGGL